MSKTCAICTDIQATHQAYVFPKFGGPVRIFFCYGHDREFFLEGQEKFLRKHGPLLKRSNLPEIREIMSGLGQRPLLKVG